MTATRRHVLLAASAAAVLPGAALAEAPEALAALGVVYVLPLIEMYATRRRAEPTGQNGRLMNAPRLADASSRGVTTPNVDTLYSSGRFDLAQGPLHITLPPAGPHYFSLALMDAWSNNFTVLGGAPAGGAERVAVIWPGAPAPTEAGVRVIRSPTRRVWALARTFAASNADLAEPHAVQKALSVAGAPSPPEAPLDPADLTPQNAAGFFALANRLMAEEGTLAADAPVLRRLKAIGVGPGLTFVDTPQTRAGAASAWAALTSPRAPAREGWAYPKPDLGDFGTDYAYRAATALGGLAALPPSEAIYLFGAGDGRGAPGTYSGGHAWVLAFPPGQEPPVDAFWSLTLYERTPEGRQYFFPNPAGKFAVAGHTPGLRREADGRLRILIAADPPADTAARGNWLPAPSGPFTLVMRLYRPRRQALDGRWRAPALTPA